jgi:predicted transcriptional regulator
MPFDMARTLTIRIKRVDQALEGFRDTFKAVVAARRVRAREGVYFASLEAARALLTPNRLALLRAVRTHRPRSIYQLARTVERDLKNVQDDLRILQRYGLVRMKRGRGTGRRATKVPEAPFGEIALKIAI